ncbi:hypothetical protein GCM10023336_46140 [Streptomyces similanensis]|uniref:Transposase IS116/IS110/IS902 C-terminal domain-containing protein n=1 Tax=Streptomyces similanensis TaxID=1274988 RepID=A0ABP9KWR1_9ACTN
MLARAQQDAVWSRQQVANQVRSLLRQYFPAALHAFQGKEGGLTRADARVILTVAPTTAKAARLTLAQLRAALKRGGRTQSFGTEAESLRSAFRAEYAHHLPAVEDAFGQQLLALFKQLDATCQTADDLATATEVAFQQHADSEILLSFPGLGPQLAARVLAEIGDDRTRFADARALKSYAGSAPITRASGKKRYVGRRFVKNNRLMHAGFLWASQPSRPRPAPTPTTGADASTETGTTPPSATCSTAFSASSTTASRPGNTSTNNTLSRHSLKHLLEPAIGHKHCQCTRLDSPRD